MKQGRGGPCSLMARHPAMAHDLEISANDEMSGVSLVGGKRAHQKTQPAWGTMWAMLRAAHVSQAKLGRSMVNSPPHINQLTYLDSRRCAAGAGSGQRED